MNYYEQNVRIEIAATEEEQGSEQEILDPEELDKETEKEENNYVKKFIYKNSEYSPKRENDYVYFKVNSLKSFAEKGK